jgi:hypothetical protein
LMTFGSSPLSSMSMMLRAISTAAFQGLSASGSLFGDFSSSPVPSACRGPRPASSSRAPGRGLWVPPRCGLRGLPRGSGRGLRGRLFKGSSAPLRDELGALAALRGFSAALRGLPAVLRSEPAALRGVSASLCGVLAALRGVLLPRVLCEVLECLERLECTDLDERRESGDLDVLLVSGLLSDLFDDRPRWPL